MIESEMIPAPALDYLNKIEASKLQEAANMTRGTAAEELLSWCNQWYTTAQGWRKSSYEANWLIWQRNSDGRFDPIIASKKKDWQAKVFVDLTPSHRESIHAELFRLVAGSRPILEVTARAGGDSEQADNIADLILREMEKSRFEVEYNKVLEDKDTYGSGFCRLWFDEKMEDRIVRLPITEPLNINDQGSINRHMSGQPIILDYQSQIQKKLIYRGVRMQSIPIWDFFADPKALSIKGNICLFRSMINLQEIIDSVKSGKFLPESVQPIMEESSNETDTGDKAQLSSERGISDVSPKREGYQKTWEYYELFGRLPQKWVFPLLATPIDIVSPDCLIPARIIFHKKTIFRVELNEDYEGEPPFIKDDYFPVAGRFYGRGIPEMLKNPQAVVNEVVNQRLDEGALALQEGYAVVEKAIRNPAELEEGGPGLVVRLDAKALGPNGDVRNAIFPLGRPDVKINAGFSEVHEWERIAQERTSANRVTLGTSGLVHDANQTLGGQQLLKESAGEKFAFIAMLSEFTFMYEVFRSYWKLIYANIKPQDVVAALGQERAAKFQLQSPEDIESSYRYEPKGIFEREAKVQAQARLAALYGQFQGAPWLDSLAFFEQEAKAASLNPDTLKVPEAEALEIMSKARMMAEPMAKEMLGNVLQDKAQRDTVNNIIKETQGKNVPA